MKTTELPNATTPLDGSELVIVVQDFETRKVPVEEIRTPQIPLIVQEEGAEKSGNVTVINFKGSGVNVTSDGQIVEVDIALEASVPSVNGKTGDVQLSAEDVDAAPNSHVGSGSGAHAEATITEAGFMSAADKAKLNNIEAEATKNKSDAHLLSRQNHTGTQPIASVAGLQDELASKVPQSEYDSYKTDKLEQIRTILVDLGFTDLGLYANSLVLSALDDFVEFNGKFYVVADSGSLPFTTTGVWIDDQTSLTELEELVAIKDRMVSKTELDDIVQNELLNLSGGLMTGVFKPANFTLATLPPAAGNTSGIIWVSDLTDGAFFCFSDGTDWRRFDTKAIAA